MLTEKLCVQPKVAAFLAAFSLSFVPGCATNQSASSEAVPLAVAPKIPPSLESLLQDDVELRVRAERWSPEASEVLAGISCEEHILNAIAVFHFRDQVGADDYRAIREGLRIARRSASSDYERSLIDLYSVVPEVPFRYGMSMAPDAVELVRLREMGWGDPSASALLPGRFYRPETIALHEHLNDLLNVLPSAEEVRTQAQALEAFKPSPLFEAIFAREAAPPELELRARVALAQIVTELQREIRALGSATSTALSPEQLFSLNRRYLKETFRVADVVQPSVVAGLATRMFDCDVYAFVNCELGRQSGLPIDIIYVLDPSKEVSIGHCMPAAVLRRGDQVRYVPYEMREAIERLPDGSERRTYASYDEMKTRVNALAGEEIFGPSTLICLLSDAAKVRLLSPYGTQAVVDLSSRDMQVLSGPKPSRAER